MLRVGPDNVNINDYTIWLLFDDDYSIEVVNLFKYALLY